MSAKKMRNLGDDEFDLVQNNGRVTLPANYGDAYAIEKHLPILILLGASLLIVLLAGRR